MAKQQSKKSKYYKSNYHFIVSRVEITSWVVKKPLTLGVKVEYKMEKE